MYRPATRLLKKKKKAESCCIWRWRHTSSTSQECWPTKWQWNIDWSRYVLLKPNLE